MRILVLRHAYAGNVIGKDARTPKDYARKLQQDGIDAANALADWMSDPKRDMVPNSIVTSPITRAVQTAQILSAAFGIKYTTDETLEISKPVEMYIKKICADKSITRPLIIAHTDNIMPALRYLNALDKADLDPIGMCELRVLKFDRSDCTWDEKLRMLPSDLGGEDHY